MKISNGAITSPVFELIRTVEFDISLGENSYTTGEPAA